MGKRKENTRHRISRRRSRGYGLGQETVQRLTVRPTGFDKCPCFAEIVNWSAGHAYAGREDAAYRHGKHPRGPVFKGRTRSPGLGAGQKRNETFIATKKQIRGSLVPANLAQPRREVHFRRIVEGDQSGTATLGPIPQLERTKGGVQTLGGNDEDQRRRRGQGSTERTGDHSHDRQCDDEEWYRDGQSPQG